MANDAREQLTTRLIDRLTRAIPGDSRATVRERYEPVFHKMTDAELALVRDRVSRQPDSHLYLVDEKVYNLLTKRSRSPLVGSYVALVFDSALATPERPQ